MRWTALVFTLVCAIAWIGLGSLGLSTPGTVGWVFVVLAMANGLTCMGMLCFTVHLFVSRADYSRNSAR